MASIKEISENIIEQFTFNEAINLSKPISLFILGIAIYALFIFKFYHFLARREIFSLDLHIKDHVRGKIFLMGGRILEYIIKHLFIFPVIILFWVIVLSIILAFLSKGSEITTILLVSVALVGVTRVMAYYHEDLSKDLAKMLPFALLGVFLVDVSYFSFAESIQSILSLFSSWKLFAYYLLFLILLEFVLRLLFFILAPFRKHVTIKDYDEES